MTKTGLAVRACLGVVGVAAVLATPATVAAARASTPGPRTPSGYVIHNGESGECVGVHGGGTANGLVIVVGRCTSDASQYWQAIATTTIGHETYHQFRNAHSGLCLGVHGSSSGGAALVQGPCGGTSDHSQFWRNAYLGKTKFYNFVNGHSGLCMGIEHSAASGNVVQGGCADTPTQSWYTGERPDDHAPSSRDRNTAFDQQLRGRLVHDLEAYRAKVKSPQTALKHSVGESVDVIVAYDPLITRLGNTFGMRKAVIQAEVYWEYWKETPLDNIADAGVESWYGYKEAYESWSKFPLGAPPLPPIGGRDDSSTGISQIFASTAIAAHNWAVDHHLITGKHLDGRDWHVKWKMWQQLHGDGNDNISTVPLVLLQGAAEVGVPRIHWNTTFGQLQRVFARYNGTGPQAAQYGTELEGVYQIFDHYNALSR
jgi:hypothetical protein